MLEAEIQRTGVRSGTKRSPMARTRREVILVAASTTHPMKSKCEMDRLLLLRPRRRPLPVFCSAWFRCLALLVPCGCGYLQEQKWMV